MRGDLQRGRATKKQHMEKTEKKKRTASQVGKYSVSKGKRAEREVANILKARGFTGAKRGQQRSGLEQADVVGLPGWRIEVKARRSLGIWAAFAKLYGECKEGERPLLLIRRAMGKGSMGLWLASVRLDDLLDLFDQLDAARLAGYDVGAGLTEPASS